MTAAAGGAAHGCADVPGHGRRRCARPAHGPDRRPRGRHRGPLRAARRDRGRRARDQRPGEPRKRGPREEREEMLADFAEARATCEWLIERGVEQWRPANPDRGGAGGAGGAPWRSRPLARTPAAGPRARSRSGATIRAPAAPAGSTSAAVSTAALPKPVARGTFDRARHPARPGRRRPHVTIRARRRTVTWPS